MRLIPQLIVAGLSCLPVLAQGLPYDAEWLRGLNLGFAPGLNNTYHPKQKIYNLGRSVSSMGNVGYKINSLDARWIYTEVYTLDGQYYVGYYKNPIVIKSSFLDPGYFGPEAPGFDADNLSIIIAAPEGWLILRKGWGGVAVLSMETQPYYGPGFVGAYYTHRPFISGVSYNELGYDGLDCVLTGNFWNGARIAYARPRWGGWSFMGPNGKYYCAGDTMDMGVDKLNQCWTLDYNNDSYTDIAYTRPGWGGYMLMLSQYGGSYTKTYVPYNNPTIPEPPPADPTGPIDPGGPGIGPIGVPTRP